MFAFLYTMESFKCTECSFETKRSDNLKRHLKNVHGVFKSAVVRMKTLGGTGQLGDRPLNASNTGSRR